MTTRGAKPQSRRFRATLEKDARNLGWTIARVPFDPAAVFPSMIRLRVRGTVNDAPFRTSLFPDPRSADGLGPYFLLVNRAVLAGAGVGLGDSVEVHLEPDLEPREAELPDELAALIVDEPGLLAWYSDLTEYTRREIGKWVRGVKSDAARLRRAEQMAERLLATKEAEAELPPILEAAFRARPRARAGWLRMTALQRRNELFAVFYYQTPESRLKRVEKLVEAAEQR